MTDLYLQSDGRDMTVWHDRGGHDVVVLTQKEAGPVLWAHLKATLPTRDDLPTEPTGLGAVVESDDGSLFVRDKVTTTKKHWKRAEGMDGSRRHAWADIRPARVIQEGYTPPDAPDADVANDYYRRLKMGRPRSERAQAVADLLGPDAPSADERPFQVGDRVRVADDARWVVMEHKGHVGVIKLLRDDLTAIVQFDDTVTQLAHRADLTHADAPC